MPQSFPDMKSLGYAAQMHKFRAVNEGETEDEFRTALADHVLANGHMIEAMEIRTGKGWDNFTADENRSMLCQNPDMKKFLDTMQLKSAIDAVLNASPLKHEGDSK